jgi:hypothetical protein
MTITKELRQEMAEILEQRHVSEKTAQDILLMCKNGLTAQEALLMRGESNPNPHTLTDLRKKSQKWLLSNPDMQKLAHKAVKETLRMKPVKVNENGEEKLIYPSHTNRLAAAAMVTDRTEPVKGSESAGDTFNFVQINASSYRNAQDMVDNDLDDHVIEGECSNIKGLADG